MDTDSSDTEHIRVARRQSAILSAVLLYAGFGSLWILLSDKVIEWLFDMPANVTLASVVKGWIFVAVTALVLYVLIRRVTGEGAPATPFAPSLRPLGWPLILFTLFIVTLTILSIAHTVGEWKREEASRLLVIADLKTRQIADWLQELQGDAEFAHSSTFFAAGNIVRA